MSSLDYSFEIVNFRKKDISFNEDLSQYIGKVSEGFCPYIEPSFRYDGITFTVLRSDTDVREVAEEIIFACGYGLSEILREKRRSSSSSVFLCENAIFLFPSICVDEGEQMLAWPHWVLKSRYTEVGLLFGKFWRGASESSKSGESLPEPPNHLLSIRETVERKDPQFFEEAEWLRPTLESSEDNNQDVFNDIPHSSNTKKLQEDLRNDFSSSLFEKFITCVIDDKIYKKMKTKARSALIEKQK